MWGEQPVSRSEFIGMKAGERRDAAKQRDPAGGSATTPALRIAQGVEGSKSQAIGFSSAEAEKEET
ncbi:hypothetical protein X749_05560 [Mesorhizobium sp. LNJC391B00]|nr:hypothetical protein X749_05560 [Mesorhizobium sp. LNJC391B00]